MIDDIISVVPNEPFTDEDLELLISDLYAAGVRFHVTPLEQMIDDDALWISAPGNVIDADTYAFLHKHNKRVIPIAQQVHARMKILIKRRRYRDAEEEAQGFCPNDASCKTTRTI